MKIGLKNGHENGERLSLVAEITYRKQYTIWSQEYQKWLKSWKEKNTRRIVKNRIIDIIFYTRRINKILKTNDKEHERAYKRAYNHQYYLAVTKPKREQLRQQQKEKQHE